MQKKTVRKFALTLALMRLLAFGGEAKANNNHVYYIIKNGNVITVNDIEMVRTNGSTIVDESELISIYQEKNLLSRQYGGNQLDFIDNFNELINDPLIWEEMQKHYPVEEFSSKETALDFYKEYFKILANCGCGYIAATNRIFEAYEGDEEKFEKTFGYPMYVVDRNGYIDYNYEIFTLAFFNYSVLYPNYSEKEKARIKKSVAKTLAEIELERYSHSEEYTLSFPTGYRPTEEELNEMFEKKSVAKKKYNELYNAYKNATDDYIDLGLALEKKYGHIKEYMKKFGVNVTVKYYARAKGKFKEGDIIASEKYTLYQMNYSDIVETMSKDGGSHYMPFVEYDEDGNIIVSSWGGKYMFDNSKAKWTSKVVLQIKK